MLRHNRFLPLLLFALAFMAASACTPKQPQVKPSSVYTGPPCTDVLTLPQDLHTYAAALPDGPLVSAGSQTAAAAAQKESLFRPWRLTAPTRWVKQSLDRNFNMRPAKAFTNGSRPFPQSLWDELVANSNKQGYGKDAGPGIVLTHSNLRAMPTTAHFYIKPDLPGEGYPFDYFQHTSIAPGTPVYIANTSRDGLWLLVESTLTSGWIPSRDVAGVDEQFMEDWQSRPLAALTRDNVHLGTGTGHIGALLPLAGDAYPGLGSSLSVHVPSRGPSGRAVMERITLSSGDAAVVPLELNARNMVAVGTPMMGQRYTWGGLDQGRDCSALTRDLFTPFGIHLPRNSSNQAKRGTVIPVAGMDGAAKQAAIASYGAPFRTLIHMPGHIGVYLGQYEGKAVFFHNMWGIRIRDAQGGCDGRAIVGKGVVTTLRPGVERPDLCTPESFLDRIERIAVLPE